jgi:hypothetical protein
MFEAGQIKEKEMSNANFQNKHMPSNYLMISQFL